MHRIQKVKNQLSGTESNLINCNEGKIFGSTEYDLQQQREFSTFAIREMTHFLDGSEECTRVKEMIMQQLEENDVFSNNSTDYDATFSEKRIRAMERTRQIYQLALQYGGDKAQRQAMMDIVSVFDMSCFIRFGVHFGLFVGAIMSQGSMEQQGEWLPRAMLLQVLGCFAMTELGHGSALRKLETTATLNSVSDEFIIHSPTDTATKWWIGGAGQTATHTACFAQLVIQGKHYGVHTFIVQLRDVNTHEKKKGITIGDCGQKMGLHGVDNGWIQFNQVRVPRSAMLCKHAEVHRDGSYVKHAKSQMAYGALIGTRGDLVMLSCNMLRKALMISIRYSAIRRQGDSMVSKNPNAIETPLLDYASHQYRLMPLLAMTYAFHFQVQHVRELLVALDSGMSDVYENHSLALLSDVHATMAGLKAFSTWATLDAMEQCRQCCGGQGYSAYNGLSNLVSDFSVMVTWEGDNTVMAQQTARYLISSYEKSIRGIPLTGLVQYLENIPTNTIWEVQGIEDTLNATHQMIAFRHLVVSRIQAVAVRLKNKIATCQNESLAWNTCQVELIQAAKLHVYYTVANQFVLKINAHHKTMSTGQLSALTSLCSLFILTQLAQYYRYFLQDSYFTNQHVHYIDETIQSLCSTLRIDAVALVDAFNLNDVILNSAIGSSNGAAYKNVLSSVLHRTGDTPYFENLIKPILQGELH